MSPEQRAVIAAAEKDGVSPIERDARLIVHGMVNATRDQMRKHQQGWDNLGEQQQDVIIANLTQDYNELALTIARALASARTPFVIATCKKLEVSNGNFTAIIKSDQPNYNDLISRVQDKGEVVIALYERQFRDGMDTIQADKDQKSLPLDDESAPTKGKAAKTESPTSAKAIAAKPIEIPPKLLADAIEFVQKNQVCATAGLQNHLKIATKKAEAVQHKLAELGHIELDDKGEYQIVRAKAAAPADPELYGELTYSEVQQTVVLHATSFELSWLSTRFKIDEESAKHLCLRLLDDGVIEAETSADLDADPKYTVIAKLEDLLI